MEPPPSAPNEEQTSEPADPSIQPEEEPVVTGTIFLTLIMLMLIFGFWAMMYYELLNR